MQSSRIFWGGLLILLGLFFLGGNVFELNAWSMFWQLIPLIMIMFGIWLFVKHPHSVIVALLISIFGLFLFLNSLGIIDITIFSLWPLILVAIGLNTLVKKDNSSVADDIEELTDTTMLASSKKIVTSGKFKSAKLTVILGSSELDLTQADLEGDVSIDAVVVMGEIKLKLPENAIITNNAIGMLGEVKNHEKVSKPDAKGKKELRVVINGASVMGELEVW